MRGYSIERISPSACTTEEGNLFAIRMLHWTKSSKRDRRAKLLRCSSLMFYPVFVYILVYLFTCSSTQTYVLQPQPKPLPPLEPYITNSTLRSQEEEAWKAIGHLLDGYNQTKLLNPSTLSRFVLFRAIGNDLPPRHKRGQTYTNVKFILENEPAHIDVDRRWYVNRLVDTLELHRILMLLTEHEQIFIFDKLDLDEYARIRFRFDFTFEPDLLRSELFQSRVSKDKTLLLDEMMHDKNLYVIGNNQVRNRMIDLAFSAGAEYALPWDGNCFVNDRAWADIHADILSMELHVHQGNGNITNKYFTTPMARMLTNEPLMDRNFKPIDIMEEPQIIFHKDSNERFNPNLRYGRRPKVELLQRLKVKGIWDTWPRTAGFWEKSEWKVSEDVVGTNVVPTVGWTARLFSGNSELEKAGQSADRTESRSSGIERIFSFASFKYAASRLNYSSLTTLLYDEEVMQANRDMYRENSSKDLGRLVGILGNLAERDIQSGVIYTVTDKPTAAPSGDFHDYNSLLPFRWLNSNFESTKDANPRDQIQELWSDYIHRDMENYDRSKLAAFGRSVTVLTLAGYFLENDLFYIKAAERVRIWFISKLTRMSPNLKYAHMSPGSPTDLGSHTGISDGTDFIIIFDSVRLLRKAGALSNRDIRALKAWVRTYLKFLARSTGLKQYISSSNHGTLFDCQIASLYAFLGDFQGVLRHTGLAQGRMLSQFSHEGWIQMKMAKPSWLLYEFSGLEPWLMLAEISKRVGVDVSSFKTAENEIPILQQGLQYEVLSFSDGDIQNSDRQSRIPIEQMAYLYYKGLELYPHLTTRPDHGIGEKYSKPPSSIWKADPMIYPYSLVPPFWNLASRAGQDK